MRCLTGIVGMMSVLGLAASAHVFAQNEESLPADDQAPQTAVRYAKSEMQIEIQSDGSFTNTIEQIVVPLTEQAVKGVAQAPLAFREDVSTMEVLAAYTLKQDGRRLDVPPERIRITAPPYAARAPIFSTQKAKVVIFPDVAVGDRLVVKARMHMHTPDFRGHFIFNRVFPRSRLHDDVHVSIRYPASMPLKFDARGLTEAPGEKSDGFVRRAWTYRNDQAIPEEQGAVDAWDREPRLIASTFAGWDDLAKAYEARAQPMTAVTPAIQKLADELTAGVTQRRDQAKALYDWVSLNIRYVGVFLGAGGFVPHSADSILANRYGDCKDHVTLLEALLAAKGIASSPVLIHTAPRFEAPSLPTPALFNHAITWLPEFGVYLDSTAQYLSFGVLSQAEMDKWVLHTRDGSKLLRTAAPAQRSIINKLQMTVAADGSVAGTVTVTGNGPAAATFRAQLSQVDTAQARPRFLQSMMSSAGFVGSAELTKDDPTKLTDAYSYSIDFKATDWLRTDSAGAFVVPSGLFSSARLAAFLARLTRPAERVNHACGPITIEEHTELQLPSTLSPGRAPKNVAFDHAAIQYSASYTLEGSTLKAARRLVTGATHGSCPPDELAVYRNAAEQMRKDLSTQVVYEPQ